MIRTNAIDEVISLDSAFRREELAQIAEFARIYGVSYRYADRFSLADTHPTEVEFILEFPVMTIRSIGLGPWGRIIKRSVDILGASMGIILLSPVFLATSLLIIASDGGAPVYRSVRIGRLGKPFTMYKFRSMRQGADKLKSKLIAKNERTEGPLFKIENDPRITRLGRFLRAYDIDELPQLFNVLLGDMSLIGPRPHLPDEVSKYEEHQRQVLTLKPGITGMAQVHGRHKNTFENEVRLDVFYIENWTLGLDISILFRTLLVVLGRGGR